MWDANVGGTERVLDAGDRGPACRRIVYVSTSWSTVTRGEKVDESFERAAGEEFTSCYEKTKLPLARGGDGPDRGGRPRS